MSKRRGFILLLFFAIGVYAVSRTLLLIRSVKEEGNGGTNGFFSRGKALWKTWRRPMDRAGLLVMVVPFLITALLLFLHTLESE